MGQIPGSLSRIRHNSPAEWCFDRRKSSASSPKEYMPYVFTGKSQNAVYDSVYLAHTN